MLLSVFILYPQKGYMDEFFSKVCRVGWPSVDERCPGDQRLTTICGFAIVRPISGNYLELADSGTPIRQISLRFYSADI